MKQEQGVLVERPSLETCRIARGERRIVAPEGEQGPVEPKCGGVRLALPFGPVEARGEEGGLILGIGDALERRWLLEGEVVTELAESSLADAPTQIGLVVREIEER
jgi:hypothetical protein